MKAHVRVLAILLTLGILSTRSPPHPPSSPPGARGGQRAPKTQP